MSEPSWYAECRRLWQEGKSKAELARIFDRKQTTIQRALNGTSTHYRRKTTHANPRMAEAAKKRWADPEWAKRQRERISAGLLNSTRPIGRPRACDNVETQTTQPWKPGDPKPEWLRRGT